MSVSVALAYAEFPHRFGRVTEQDADAIVVAVRIELLVFGRRIHAVQDFVPNEDQ